MNPSNNPLGFLLIPPTDNSQTPSQSAQSIEVDDCPICFELLLPPVYQCHAGHLLCENCESRLQICPQCRNQLPGSPKIRNLYAEQAIGAKVFKCNSCFTSVQGDDVKDHREDCLLRAHNYCKHLNIHCDHQCTRAQLVDHLTSVHLITGQKLSESVFGGTRISVELEQVASAIDLLGIAQQTPIRFSPHFVQCMSRLFIVSTNVQTMPFGTTYFSWTIFGIGGKKVCKDILVKIRLTAAYPSLNYLEWQGPIYPIKSNLLGNVFTVSGETLEGLVTSSEQQDYQVSDNPFLKWNIEITFTKKSELVASAAVAGSSVGVFQQNLPTLKTGFISADRFLFCEEVVLEPVV